MSRDPAALDAALPAAPPPTSPAPRRHRRQLAGDGRPPSSTAARWPSGQSGDLSALDELSANVTGAGVEDLMLDPGTTGLVGDLAAATQLRRLALKKNYRSLGYPIVAFAAATSP